MTGKKTQEHLEQFNNLLAEMMSATGAKKGSLDQIRVLEISYANFPGLVCGAMLGEMGATVIKIEPPEGDAAREATYYGRYINGVGLPFVIESRNKLSVTIDFNDEEGIANIKKLAEKADILIDAMKPGHLDELGIGYRQLSPSNKGLIYVSVSPYGHYTKKGEEFRNIPDTDLTAQSESGYPALSGNPKAPEPYNVPVKAGIWAATYMSAAVGVAGILTALIHRDRTGEGQMVDLATYDALCSWPGFSLVWGFTTERPRTRVGNYDWCLFPYGYYKAKDGYVTVSAATDADFRSLIKILGRWDLEDDWRFLFDRIADDPEKLDELEAEMKKEIATHTQEELTQKTLAYGAKAARDPLRSKGFPMVVKTLKPEEVMKEQHWKIRKSFLECEIPDDGTVIIPALPPRMSETPAKMEWLKVKKGEDNEKVAEEYGLKLKKK
ncbi:MAG: CoA transferase [Syntrophales bacterium]|nr:CoA transferase [Syntrophales bacterium]MDY0044294.1 CoA transferase [Syntrophales bacterium]